MDLPRLRRAVHAALAYLTSTQAAALWTVLCTAALAAIIHRIGLAGWRLSALTTGAILFTSPVRETLGQGQLGLFIVAAVILDVMPGPRVFGRRILPEGWLVGVATAVKLTPATVAAYQFFSGRLKASLVAFGSFLAATALGFVLLPGESAYYWTRLVIGDTGMNATLIYAANQSVFGTWARLTGSTGSGGSCSACWSSRSASGPPPWCIAGDGRTWPSVRPGWPACSRPRSRGGTTTSG